MLNRTHATHTLYNGRNKYRHEYSKDNKFLPGIDIGVLSIVVAPYNGDDT